MGVGDIVRRVRTEFVVNDRPALMAAARVNKAWTKVGNGATRVRQAVGRALMVPTAVAGIGAAGLVGHLIQVGKETESSELKITSMLLQAQKFSNLQVGGFGQAHTAAKELRLEMERLAVASPATGIEIEKSFADLTLELSQAGLTLRQQAEFARTVVTREKLEGLQQGTTARDVRDILRGRKILTQTASLVGVRDTAAESARGGDKAKALAEIQNALALTNEELEAFGGSFEGKIASASDAFLRLKRVAAGPLMEFLIGKLDEMTGFLSANEEQAKAIALEWGQNITSAVSAVVDFAQTLAENFGLIVDAAKVLGTVWIGSVIVGALAKAAAGAATLYGWLVRAAAASQAIGGGGIGGAGGGGGLLSKIGKGAAGAARFLGPVGVGVGLAAGGIALTASLIQDRIEKGNIVDTGRVGRSIEGARQVADAPGLLAFKQQLAGGRGGGAASHERGILDKKLAATIAEEGEKKKKKRGGRGGGSKKIDISSATINIGNGEIAGDTFARLANPLVLELFAEVSGQRPISAEAGLSGIPLPNGTGR